LIFASLTGPGGAVTLLRLSGNGVLSLAVSLCGRLPPPRQARLRTLRHEGEMLDRALVTVFPAPASFTGEDCVELGLHGGRAVHAAVAMALVALGARPAEPGEFSRRAYLNGRLSLLAAEATAELIAAETQAQRAQALEGGDALDATVSAWRDRLRRLMANQEALIDFPDEDLPAHVEAGLRDGINALGAEMTALLATAPAAARLREGLEFVILGPPNAGKSTLLNALAGEDVAIVAATPGTTRDVVGARLDLGGVPVRMTDTAGLRETSDEIEAQGIRRATARAAAADLIIAVAAAPDPSFSTPPPGPPVLHVITKADLLATFAPGFTTVSAQTGAGMDGLRRQLTEAARRLTARGSAAALSRPRHTACLRDAADALLRARDEVASELRGEDLRAAATALARLAGTIGVEEVLDAVFSGFCIGK
jgi:tRNA modification GTPase